MRVSPSDGLDSKWDLEKYWVLKHALLYNRRVIVTAIEPTNGQNSSWYTEHVMLSNMHFMHGFYINLYITHVNYDNLMSS